MLEKFEPKDVFYWFEELSKIPRCSRQEKKVSDFLVDFAKKRNLEVYQDHENNVIIKKPATPGYESKSAIILQGHMDMVCVKVKGSSHNFCKDPLKLEVKDGWISAEGTTLGGDDGIAVAYALAFLDGNYPHPALEVLITTQEELGMEGALAVTGENLSGKYLFNIDGEVENELIVGCAGGVTITSVKELEKVKPSLKTAYRIEIEELTGGHSGQEIHKSRANSIKIAAQLLDRVSGKVELISLSGGSKHNAVPTTAVIELFADNEAIEELKKKAEELKKNYRISDPDMIIVFTSIDSEEKVWTADTLKEVVETLVAVPDGVCYMDPMLDGLVETSLSNGVLEQKDNKLYLTTLLRSSNKAREIEVKRRFELIVTSNGFEMSDNGGYPGWKYDPDSELRVKTIEVYKKQFGKEPIVKAMHFGLECGILKIPLPNTDMITFGPDMQAIHTVNERLNIESVGRIWEFLKTLVISLD